MTSIQDLMGNSHTEKLLGAIKYAKGQLSKKAWIALPQDCKVS